MIESINPQTKENDTVSNPINVSETKNGNAIRLSISIEIPCGCGGSGGGGNDGGPSLVPLIAGKRVRDRAPAASLTSKQDIENHVLAAARRKLNSGAELVSEFSADLQLTGNAVKVFILDMIKDLEEAGLQVNATPQSLAGNVKTIGDLVDALATAAGLE